MNKETIKVITDKEELYEYCENMEQLYDKFYLPLLDVHYRKTYDLQQELKEAKNYVDFYENLTKKQYDLIYELIKTLKDEDKNV